MSDSVKSNNKLKKSTFSLRSLMGRKSKNSSNESIFNSSFSASDSRSYQERIAEQQLEETGVGTSSGTDTGDSSHAKPAHSNDQENDMKRSSAEEGNQISIERGHVEKRGKVTALVQEQQPTLNFNDGVLELTLTRQDHSTRTGIISDVTTEVPSIFSSSNEGGLGQGPGRQVPPRTLEGFREPSTMSMISSDRSTSKFDPSGFAPPVLSSQENRWGQFDTDDLETEAHRASASAIANCAANYAERFAEQYAVMEGDENECDSNGNILLAGQTSHRSSSTGKAFGSSSSPSLHSVGVPGSEVAKGYRSMSLDIAEKNKLLPPPLLSSNAEQQNRGGVDRGDTDDHSDEGPESREQIVSTSTSVEWENPDPDGYRRKTYDVKRSTLLMSKLEELALDSKWKRADAESLKDTPSVTSILNHSSHQRKGSGGSGISGGSDVFIDQSEREDEFKPSESGSRSASSHSQGENDDEFDSNIYPQNKLVVEGQRVENIDEKSGSKHFRPATEHFSANGKIRSRRDMMVQFGTTHQVSDITILDLYDQNETPKERYKDQTVAGALIRRNDDSDESVGGSDLTKSSPSHIDDSTTKLLKNYSISRGLDESESYADSEIKNTIDELLTTTRTLFVSSSETLNAGLELNIRQGNDTKPINHSDIEGHRRLSLMTTGNESSGTEFTTSKAYALLERRECFMNPDDKSLSISLHGIDDEGKLHKPLKFVENNDDKKIVEIPTDESDRNTAIHDNDLIPISKTRDGTSVDDSSSSDIVNNSVDQSQIAPGEYRQENPLVQVEEVSVDDEENKLDENTANSGGSALDVGHLIRPQVDREENGNYGFNAFAQSNDSGSGSDGLLAPNTEGSSESDDSTSDESYNYAKVYGLNSSNSDWSGKKLCRGENDHSDDEENAYQSLSEASSEDYGVYSNRAPSRSSFSENSSLAQSMSSYLFSSTKYAVENRSSSEESDNLGSDMHGFKIYTENSDIEDSQRGDLNGGTYTKYFRPPHSSGADSSSTEDSDQNKRASRAITSHPDISDQEVLDFDHGDEWNLVEADLSSSSGNRIFNSKSVTDPLSLGTIIEEARSRDEVQVKCMPQNDEIDVERSKEYVEQRECSSNSTIDEQVDPKADPDAPHENTKSDCIIDPISQIPLDSSNFLLSQTSIVKEVSSRHRQAGLGPDTEICAESMHRSISCDDIRLQSSRMDPKGENEKNNHESFGRSHSDTNCAYIGSMTDASSQPVSMKHSSHAYLSDENGRCNAGMQADNEIIDDRDYSRSQVSSNKYISDDSSAFASYDCGSETSLSHESSNKSTDNCYEKAHTFSHDNSEFMHWNDGTESSTSTTLPSTVQRCDDEDGSFTPWPGENSIESPGRKDDKVDLRLQNIMSVGIHNFPQIWTKKNQGLCQELVKSGEADSDNEDVIPDSIVKTLQGVGEESKEVSVEVPLDLIRSYLTDKIRRPCREPESNQEEAEEVIPEGKGCILLPVRSTNTKAETSLEFDRSLLVHSSSDDNDLQTAEEDLMPIRHHLSSPHNHNPSGYRLSEETNSQYNDDDLSNMLGPKSIHQDMHGGESTTETFYVSTTLNNGLSGNQHGENEKESAIIPIVQDSQSDIATSSCHVDARGYHRYSSSVSGDQPQPIDKSDIQSPINNNNCSELPDFIDNTTVSEKKQNYNSYGGDEYNPRARSSSPVIDSSQPTRNDCTSEITNGFCSEHCLTLRNDHEIIYPNDTSIHDSSDESPHSHIENCQEPVSNVITSEESTSKYTTTPERNYEYPHRSNNDDQLLNLNKTTTQRFLIASVDPSNTDDSLSTTSRCNGSIHSSEHMYSPEIEISPNNCKDNQERIKSISSDHSAQSFQCTHVSTSVVPYNDAVSITSGSDKSFHSSDDLDDLNMNKNDSNHKYDADSVRSISSERRSSGIQNDDDNYSHPISPSLQGITVIKECTVSAATGGGYRSSEDDKDDQYSNLARNSCTQRLDNENAKNTGSIATADCASSNQCSDHSHIAHLSNPNNNENSNIENKGYVAPGDYTRIIQNNDDDQFSLSSGSQHLTTVPIESENSIAISIRSVPSDSKCGDDDHGSCSYKENSSQHTMDTQMEFKDNSGERGPVAWGDTSKCVQRDVDEIQPSLNESSSSHHSLIVQADRSSSIRSLGLGSSRRRSGARSLHLCGNDDTSSSSLRSLTIQMDQRGISGRSLSSMASGSRSSARSLHLHGNDDDQAKTDTSCGSQGSGTSGSRGSARSLHLLGKDDTQAKKDTSSSSHQHSLTAQMDRSTSGRSLGSSTSGSRGSARRLLQPHENSGAQAKIDASSSSHHSVDRSISERSMGSVTSRSRGSARSLHLHDNADAQAKTDTYSSSHRSLTAQVDRSISGRSLGSGTSGSRGSARSLHLHDNGDAQAKIGISSSSHHSLTAQVEERSISGRSLGSGTSGSRGSARSLHLLGKDDTQAKKDTSSSSHQHSLTAQMDRSTSGRSLGSSTSGSRGSARSLHLLGKDDTQAKIDASSSSHHSVDRSISERSMGSVTSRSRGSARSLHLHDNADAQAKTDTYSSSHRSLTAQVDRSISGRSLDSGTSGSRGSARSLHLLGKDDTQAKIGISSSSHHSLTAQVEERSISGRSLGSGTSGSRGSARSLHLCGNNDGQHDEMELPDDNDTVGRSKAKLMDKTNDEIPTERDLDESNSNSRYISDYITKESTIGDDESGWSTGTCSEASSFMTDSLFRFDSGASSTVSSILNDAYKGSGDINVLSTQKLSEVQSIEPQKHDNENIEPRNDRLYVMADLGNNTRALTSTSRDSTPMASRLYQSDEVVERDVESGLDLKPDNEQNEVKPFLKRDGDSDQRRAITPSTPNRERRQPPRIQPFHASRRIKCFLFFALTCMIMASSTFFALLTKRDDATPFIGENRDDGSNYGGDIASDSSGENSADSFPTESPDDTLMSPPEGNFQNKLWEEYASIAPSVIVNDQAGISLAISNDGTTLVIGAPHYSSLGLDKNGIIRIYDLMSNSNDETENWVEVKKFSGRRSLDQFGFSVSLSADSNVLAVGAPGHDIKGGFPTNEGRVYMYDLSDENPGNWHEDYSFIGDKLYGQSGYAVSLERSGKHLAIGMPLWDKARGGVVVYMRAPRGDWYQVGDILNGTAADDKFGSSVSIVHDGLQLAVGAPSQISQGSRGYTKIYRHRVDGWEEMQQISSSSEEEFGKSISQTPDGMKLVVGAPSANNERGIVRVYVKDQNTFYPVGSTINGFERNDRLGSSVSFSSDASTFAVGIPGRGSYIEKATGSAIVYHLKEDEDTFISSKEVYGEGNEDFGSCVALSGNGSFLVVGSPATEIIRTFV